MGDPLRVELVVSLGVCEGVVVEEPVSVGVSDAVDEGV